MKTTEVTMAAPGNPRSYSSMLSQSDSNRVVDKTGRRRCATCNRLEPPWAGPGHADHLKNCAKCRTTLYCSRECQKRDWKQHKQTCGKGQQPSLGKPAFMPLNVGNPFDGASERKAFEIVIDSYRLRVEDEYTMCGDARGRYGEMNPRPDFHRYLRRAEKKGGVLPSWWSPEKHAACMRLACARNS